MLDFHINPPFFVPEANFFFGFLREKWGIFPNKNIFFYFSPVFSIQNRGTNIRLYKNNFGK